MKTKTTIREFYRRKLPHIIPVGGLFFVTSRLKDSIPKNVVLKLKMERDQKIQRIMSDPKLDPQIAKKEIENERLAHFKRFDDWLDRAEHGPTYLKDPIVAGIVADKFKSYDGKYYELDAFTILSNHYHLLIDTFHQIKDLPPRTKITEENFVPLNKIMKYINGGSAFEANKALGRKGSFWQIEPYDRLVRDEDEYFDTLRYIVDNPVKAGLVKNWQDWPFTYVNEKYRGLL
jgi:putative transposase